VFERFTERARQVVVLSQDEARLLRHNYIGTEHLLLGLLREQEGLAARVLGSLGVKVDEVRTRVAEVVGQGEEMHTGQIPFTPRAKKVLEGALNEAEQFGHRYIGTEHLLLGLSRLDDGVAATILLDFDADAAKIRSEAIRLVGSPDYAKQAAAADAPRLRPHGLANETLTQTVGELIVSLAKSDERDELEMAIEAAIRALTIRQLLDAVQYTKESYIKEGDFEPAARFPDIQRRLVKAIGRVQAQGA
jgi:ATP-dependent Clp protease ATP-binding subunit ClpA